MKKILILSVFSFITLFANAQTEKGNILIGGDFNMDFVWEEENSNLFSFNLNTVTGLFVTENFALGGGFGYSFSVLSELDFSSSSITLYPLMRYYFKSDMPVQFFIDVRPGLSLATFEGGGNNRSEIDFIFRGGPGLAAFLSDNVSVDFSLNYYKDPQFFSEVNRIGLNVGLQVYLNQNNNNN